jgi:hypothetical protein
MILGGGWKIPRVRNVGRGSKKPDRHRRFLRRVPTARLFTPQPHLLSGPQLPRLPDYRRERLIDRISPSAEQRLREMRYHGGGRAFRDQHPESIEHLMDHRLP